MDVYAAAAQAHNREGTWPVARHAQSRPGDRELTRNGGCSPRNSAAFALFFGDFGAVAKGMIDNVKWNWCPPMYAAAANGHAGVVQALIQSKVSVNQATEHGWTPLHVTASCNFVECTKLLLSAGADVNHSGPIGRTPLFSAAQRGHSDAARVLLKANANANASDTSGNSPLHVAVRAKRTETVQCLIEHNADLEQRQAWGQTPLFLAAESGHVPTLKVLLETSPNLDHHTTNRQTPEAVAIVNGQIEAAAMLRRAARECVGGDPMASVFGRRPGAAQDQPCEVQAAGGRCYKSLSRSAAAREVLGNDCVGKHFWNRFHAKYEQHAQLRRKHAQLAGAPPTDKHRKR